MKEAVQEITKSTLTVIIAFGVLLLLIGAVDEFTVGGASLRIADSNMKLFVGTVGAVLLLFGVYAVWREGPQKTGKSDSTTPPSSKTTVDPISTVHTLRSPREQPPAKTKITFLNSSDASIDAHWLDFDGREDDRGFGLIVPGDMSERETFSTHPWLLKDASTGEHLMVVIPRNRTDHRFTIVVEPRN